MAAAALIPIETPNVHLMLVHGAERAEAFARNRKPARRAAAMPVTGAASRCGVMRAAWPAYRQRRKRWRYTSRTWR